MSIDLRTFRSLTRHLTRFLTFAGVLGFAAALAAQALQPIAENGRIVWTNDGPSHPAAAKASGQERQLVYWSNSEGRWKPVRPATSGAMRSARVLADKVSNYIESRPPLNLQAATPIKAELAEQDPNYSRVADNRSISAAAIDRYIDEAAARHHVDPNLVRALVKVESNFNPRAVSSKGAMGLMQLMPATARMYEVRNPFDVAQNVDAGVRHLKGLLQNFGGDVSLSLAAYNAGQGAVERNGGIPPYTETRNYVRRITNLMGSGAELGFTRLPDPIRVSRDERGRLVFNNTD